MNKIEIMERLLALYKENASNDDWYVNACLSDCGAMDMGMAWAAMEEDEHKIEQLERSLLEKLKAKYE